MIVRYGLIPILIAYLQEGAGTGPDVYCDLQPPEDGINVHGLFIDAGRWDMQNGCLVDALPGLYLNATLHLSAIRTVFKCCFYLNPVRSRPGPPEHMLSDM